MSAWQPIETAPDYLRSLGLPALLEKGGNVCTWGCVLLLCPKEKDRSGSHIFVGKFLDWGDGNKNSHWRDANSHDDDGLEPTHWMPLPPPPVTTGDAA